MSISDHGVFVYVSCADSQEIHVLRMDIATGALDPVQAMPVAGKAMPMAVTPDRRFLYAALRNPPYAVAAFAIDQQSGRLTALNIAPLPLSALFLSVDATGRHLFATTIPEAKDRRHSMISVTAIGPHGHVHPARQVFRAEPKIHSVLPDPTNRFLFAASCVDDVVLCHPFDAATGRLQEIALHRSRTVPHAGPRHMVFHPDGRRFYLLNETDGTIYSYDFDAETGALTERQIIDAIAPQNRVDGPMGADIHLTPDGRFLYASERGGHTLAAFAVAADGLLSRIGHFPTERQPRGFRIDPFGRFAVVAGQFSHAISVHAIDPVQGTLERRHQYPLGKTPNWVEILRLW